MRGILLGALVLAGSSLTTASASAAAGDLDPSFGSGGKVVTDIRPESGERARAVAVQSDGKIVAGGEGLVLVRYNADGSIDTGFGDRGKVTPIVNPLDIVILEDGKILFAGDAGGVVAVARYRPDGTPDTSFGNGGRAVTDFPVPPGVEYWDKRSSSTAVAIQPDGRIVVSGEVITRGFGPSSRALGLARFTPEGRLDTSFGDGGIAMTGILDSDAVFRGTGIALLGDGRIAATTTRFKGDSYDFFVARFTQAGGLDGSFGGTGLVTTNLRGSTSGPSSDYALDIAVQDRQLVVAGYSGLFDDQRDTDFYDFAVVRYAADGSLDRSFGAGGKVFTSIGDEDGAEAIAVQPDDRIVVAGLTFSDFESQNDGDFALARYTPDGALDTSFGAGGKVTTSFGSGRDVVYDLAFQPDDGKLVASGGSFDGQENDFALARYQVLSPPSPSQPAPVAPPPGAGSPAPGSGSGLLEVTEFGMDPRAFAPTGEPTAKAAAVRRVRRGSNFRYTLSKSASVTIAVDRAVAGRRVGRRCRRATSRQRGKRSCVRYVRSGGLTRRDRPAGPSITPFTGRIGRRALRPGRYRATILATDPAGERSAPRAVTFKILRPPTTRKR